MNTTIGIILLLLVAVVALAIAAPRLRVPYSILLVLGGLLLGFVPGLPRIELNHDLVFFLFLPPLLYSSAWFTSWRAFQANLRPIFLLAVGLVITTTVLIAAVAHTVIGLSWPVAFVLGAIISPTDAVAATSIAQRMGIARRITTVLEGESLVNDATGLVAYSFAVAAVGSGTFSLLEASGEFVFVSIGGLLIGLVSGWLVGRVHRYLDNAEIEITITLLTPFAVYLLAEMLHVSGILAVVTTGLYLTWRAPTLFSSGTRLQANAVWNTLIFLLNGLVFILIGLQLRGILDAPGGEPLPTSIWYACIVGLAAILVRIAWVFPATYLPRLASRRLRARDPYPDWRNVMVVAWTGMRGVVSLAAALALPPVIAGGSEFPERNLIIFLTFSTILITLVGQGLSLPLLIRWLGLQKDRSTEDEEVQARLAATRAALARLEELSQEDWVPQHSAQHLRSHYEARTNSIAQRINEADIPPGEDGYIAYQRLQQEALQAERTAVIDLRNRGEISDEALHRIERELDLEEQRLRG